MQHPCSHYNAFRNIRSQTRLSLRTKQHNRSVVIFFSFYFLNALQSDINSNRAARAKMSLSRAQNIFMPANINSIVILNSVIAKYRDLSVSRRSIICLSLRLRQIIYLLATDKSRYFAQPCPIIVNYFLKVLHLRSG